MTIADVMTKEVASIAPGEAIAEARNVMRRQRIHHLVVVRGGDLLGIVSARDLARRRDTGKPDRRTVADVMTRHVLTASASATLGRAAWMMRGHSIGCLVVLQRGRVAGIVTPSDLLGLVAEQVKRRARADTRTAVHHRVAHRHRTAGGVW